MGLTEWRRAAGLTQRELARLARVSRASISHVETERYSPSPGLAGKLCRALAGQLGHSVQTWHVFPQSFTVPEGLTLSGSDASGEPERRQVRLSLRRQEANDAGC
jgi:DNA-binding XRE family transcriptional regulator